MTTCLLEREGYFRCHQGKARYDVTFCITDRDCQTANARQEFLPVLREPLAPDESEFARQGSGARDGCFGQGLERAEFEELITHGIRSECQQQFAARAPMGRHLSSGLQIDSDELDALD